ncbi:glycosyltransferase [Falsiroseomonas sp.]|uniref:glycosyltransferase n=1 Tax=Falsiroseomonas sp. TaxID=2870721 RepID=UPI003F70A06A
MPVPVINCTMYRDNPYTEVLYSGLAERYVPLRGRIDDAIARLQAREKVLLHIHWEEHIVRPCRTEVEARVAADYFRGAIERFVAMGGRLVWTVHNSLPHELEHVQQFLQIRQAIGDGCDRILVHNTEAINVLADQIRLDRRKIYFLPHPSYLGVYEPEAAAQAAIAAPPATPHGRNILSFGKIRRYKGTERLIEVLTPDFLAAQQAKLQISGEPIPEDPFLDELRTQAAGREDILWDIRKVEDAEVPALMRGAACVVIPYERFLTSGVALLALSVGSLLIGPATRQLRELLPVVSQRFLFEPDSAEDLRRAVADALALTAEERAGLARAYLDRAAHFHPQRISQHLGRVLDPLLH